MITVGHLSLIVHKAVEGLKEVFEGRCSKREKDHESMIRDLHVKVGELTVERDFFAGCRAESLRAVANGGTRRGVERALAVPVAGDQSIIAVLHGERGEPGERRADGQIRQITGQHGKYGLEKNCADKLGTLCG